MTRTEAIERLTDLFMNDEELFNTTIEELDSYNGYLGDDRYYPMYELNEFYSHADPLEILNRAFYGSDEYGTEFNPNREYFTYDGYGNLVSADNKDYSSHLDIYFIDSLIDNADMLSLSEEVETILNDLED